MPVDFDFNYDETTAALEFFSQKDIEELHNWTHTLDNSKLVPKDLSDKQLVLFYNACHGDMVKTKLCLEKFYECRKNAPEFFNNRTLKAEGLKTASQVLEIFILPGKSCEGYEIIYHRLHDTDPSKFDLDYFCKLLFMTVDLSLTTRGPQPGYIFLYDMKGMKFSHITCLNLSTLRKLFQYVQEAVPVRVQAIHVLNTDAILENLMTLIKPFMDKNLLKIINFHKINEDLEKLYEVVPRASLPSDYGGHLADTQTLHKQCMDKLEGLEPYYKAEEEQRIAALPNSINSKYIEGTFKMLEFD